MSGVLRALRVLALAALFNGAVIAFGAEKRVSSISPDSSGEESTLEEPILLVPNSAATRQKSSAAASSKTPVKASRAAKPADDEHRVSFQRERESAVSAYESRSRKSTSAARSYDSRVTPASAGEPTPAKAPARAKSSSSKRAPAHNYTEPRELVTEPQFLDGPDPSYHPARVARKSAGWYLTGAEPGGHENVPIPMPEAENISAPSVDGEFMPFDEGFGGEYVDGVDGGYLGSGGIFGGFGLNGDNYFSGLGGYMPNGRQWAVIGGADWLLIRPHFSQAVGTTETITTQSGARVTTTHDTHQFNPGYQGAFRTYVGFRNVYCGDEVRFGFLNYNGVDNLSGTASANTQFCDFLCNTTPNPGDSVDTHFNLGANIWDLDCVRPFFFNPPCNDCCGPRCHPWDLRWFGGLRLAYINHSISSVVTDARNADGLLSTAAAQNRFTGFGLRAGLQARKYFGPQGRVSVYGRGAGSLLVGNVYQSVTTSTSSSIESPTTSVLYNRNSRIVPVGELELGGTVFLAPRFALSAGWMLMSFWDLGLQETGAMETPPLDTSNILGFDGFFLRGELVF